MTTVRLALLAGASAAQTVFAAGIADFPPSTQTGVTYAKDIEPIFKQACFRCHGPDKQSAKLRLDSLDAILKGGKDGPVLVAGKSATSDLVLNIAQIGDTPMPPKPRPARGAATNSASATGRAGSQPMVTPPLTKEQVGLVRAWIDQGAK
jgi:mono/diheme cytochrome c family protein